jgi:hypothetical protein
MFKELFDRNIICKDLTEGEDTVLVLVLLLIFNTGIKMKCADKEFHILTRSLKYYLTLLYLIKIESILYITGFSG